MKELEDTKCKVRRSIHLQLSIWDRSSGYTEDDGVPPGSPGYSGDFAPLGDFFEDANYAWLSCGPRLVILNVKSGTSIGSWTFRDRVTCVSPFPAQPGQVPLLLVGLDNGASKVRDSSGLVCVFDCATSQVLRAIRMPAGVEQICVVTGGAEWEEFGDRRIENLMQEYSGIACVALRNLHHLAIDLRRTSWEGPDAEPVADESSPAELDMSEWNEAASSRYRPSREKHMAYNLMNNRLEQYIGFNRDEFESSSLYQDDSLTCSMIFCRKIGCLVSGCLGRIIIWQIEDGAVRWVSPPSEENASISDLALLEPSDDPRPFCYLWAAYQEETSRLPPVLRMYAMLFERKYTDKGANCYYNLESDPSLKFELELEPGNAITSLCPVTRDASNPEQTECGSKRGEDSLLLVNLQARTLLFDLNQWYKEQMPRTVDECHNPNSFLASYGRTGNDEFSADDATLTSAYIAGSLKEFASNGPSPPEELFFPNSLSLEWVDLGTARLTFWMTRGLQAELLRDMSIAGPVILIDPTETFNRCLTAGLVPSGAEISLTSDKDLQRETLLSLCLEQRWSQFLLRCANEWSDGSASYLFHGFLRWAMQRASTIKLTAHRLCIPLYDQSGSTLGEAEVKTLRFFAQQLECISNVVSSLLIDSLDLTRQQRTLGRLATYLPVLLWFYDVGLLPETQELEDEESTSAAAANASNATMPFSLKIPYPFERLATIYREKRRKFHHRSAGSIATTDQEQQQRHLFIDELVSRECAPLKSQWEKEGAELSEGGDYPPPSLQSLLRSYLTDCHTPDSNEIENKHQITIYLLMDLAMLLPGSCPGVDQLIKYPSAFKLSPSLIKLTQALWHLDHEDYHGFLDMMTGQLVSDSDVKDWHHKLVLRTLIRNNQNKLALIYLRVRKPPLSSLDDQATVISLSVEHGLVQSAFHRRPPSHYTQLLARFFHACKIHGKLNDILHLALDPEEEEAFVKFLENNKSDDTRLLYYLQRCRYAEASAVYPASAYSSQPTSRGNLARKSDKQPASLTIFTAYHATLPDITRKFSGNMTRRVFDVDADSRYPRPMSHSKNRGRNTRAEIHETVIRKAKETFVRGERSQIPFISAPCSSLRVGNAANVDSNCVLFVERAKKPYGKRTLEDRRDADEDDEASVLGYNNGEERKRRKTADTTATPDHADGREVGMSMVFDTPLVKRKNQMINARDTPLETPHSILKIRQMIRKSTSPGVARPTTADANVEEKERKPRQIRFSIGQQQQLRFEASKADEADIAEENDESVAMASATNSSASSSPTLTGSVCDEQQQHKRRQEQQDVEKEDDRNQVFFSPNVSGSWLSETSLLNDSSFASRSVCSGPRPRPSLRRSNLAANDSSSELLRRSTRASDASGKRSLTPTSTDSGKISSDLSNSRSDANNIEPRLSRGSLLSTSIYSSSILSSDTSFEGTPVTNFAAKDSSMSPEREFQEKPRDLSEIHGLESTVNCSSFVGTRCHREVTMTSIIRTSVREEYTRSAEDDDNSEVLMEVDGFGLDRDSETRSRADPECPTLLEESHTKDDLRRRLDEDRQEKDDDEDRQKDVADYPGETPSSKPLDDYEDELLALKYEEDEDENEDNFQSLTNSMEVEQPQPSERRSIVPAAETPIANNGFHVEKSRVTTEELTITDDESSRASLTTESTSANNELLEKTISVEKMVSEDVIEQASNITDDESNHSIGDSSVFSSGIRMNSSEAKHTPRAESDRVANEEDSSLDSSIFSSGLGRNEDTRRKWGFAKTDSEEMDPSSMASNAESELSDRESESHRDSSPIVNKGRRLTRDSKIGLATPSKTRSPRAAAPVATPTATTPLRRSRRASSIAKQEPASPLPESPLIKTTLRRASSLASDVFPLSVESPSKRRGLRRSVSLLKEISVPAKDSESPSEEEPSTRRGSSRQAPSTPKTPAKVTRSASRVSLTAEPTHEEPTADKKRTRTRRTASESEPVATIKRSTRGSSVAKESGDEPETGKRLTRAASVAKEIPEEEDEEVAATSTTKKRVTRKRANSVPKETTDVTTRNVSVRGRRGAAAKDVIPEESVESVQESSSKGSSRRATSRVDSVKPASPATSTRSRLSSISSIPEEHDEEEEEIFSAAVSRSKVGERKRAMSARERRAVSMDPPQLEIKRRTRAASVKSAISEDTIEEEPSEGEVAADPKAKGTRKAPTRRKRATSVTSVGDEHEQGDKVAEKAPARRTRKLSQRSNESTESFRFSPPDRAQDGPDDDQDEIGDVPGYVFSPPQTRSKHSTSTTQPRRKIKDFIPLTEEERTAARRVPRPQVPPIVKTTNTMDLWGPHTVFVLPKRSRSTPSEGRQ